ncbi:AraC family transcriptional regulator [Acinetobacter stercoris]|uniref:Exoenzyme S synthesis regulatory protein ExsA n=1 Tax=Acinetobacter stercoris TaxID=2126983 RepID=A0A2U3MZ05_9GAMM|nr:AraC family transcriptional regulator [Acinetobacter stercoris]SPL70666.1 Exoenzyme S synthesis regulatory protein ExsA [Acinetobacter stercoris]
MNHHEKMDYLHYLNKSTLLDSDDYQLIKENISRYLCPHEFSVETYQPVQTILNGFEFGHSALLDLRYCAPVSIRIDSMEYYLFRMTLAGQCQVETADKCIIQVAGKMSISSPLTRSKVSTDGKCRNIILKICRQDLEKQLQQLLGYPLQDALIFDDGTGCAGEVVETFIQTINYLCQAYYTLQNWHYLIDSFSEYLNKLILLNIPHNYSDQLKFAHQQLLPSAIKKAKIYIDTHLDSQLSLDEISQHVGISIRSLQKGFSDYLKQSPGQYIRDKRLEMIHFSLKHSHGESCVTDIAMRYGINSLGHFSAQYKKRYGCMPSETLKTNSFA